MLRNCLILVLVIVAVHSAIILQKNIPVEVRYERLNHNIHANLAEQVQLSPEEIRESQLRLEKLVQADEAGTDSVDHSVSIKNLSEKVQLSPEELAQAPKHIPVQDTFDELKSETADPDALRNKNLISTIQEYVENRLVGLRKNFVPKSNENAPPKELWERFEKDVRKYFEEEKTKTGLRQNQPSIFQNVAGTFQQVANNFIGQLQQGQNNTSPSGTSGDEGTSQSPFQGFIGYFTGGVQNIVATIQNVGQGGSQGNGNSTVLGDSGSSSQQPGTGWTNFISGVQQFFQGPQQGINQILTGNNSQSDTEAPASPTGGIQQVFGNIGNVLNTFVQGGSQQNKPQGSEDENSSQAPNQNFIQSFGQNIGNVFQGIQNQFFGGANNGSSGGQLPQIPSSITNPDSNPIVGQVSNIGNQIQQVAGQAVSNNAIQNLIPGGPTTSASASAESSSESSGQKNIKEEQKTSEGPAKETEKSTEAAEGITAMA